MTPELSSIFIQAAGAIILGVTTAIGIVLRVTGKRYERRERERAAESKRLIEEADARSKSEIAELQLRYETNREILKSLHESNEQNGKLIDTVIKQTGILQDFGKVLSANSSELVSHTEEIGELVERTGAVRDDIGNLDKAVKKIEHTVNDLKIAIGETGNVSVIERLNNIQKIVDELKTKPLQIVPPSDDKPTEAAA